MNFTTWQADTFKRYNQQTEQRLGQFFFNELYKSKPNLANKIRGTEIDPFYDNKLLDKFFNCVQDKFYLD